MGCGLRGPRSPREPPTAHTRTPPSTRLGHKGSIPDTGPSRRNVAEGETEPQEKAPAVPRADTLQRCPQGPWREAWRRCQHPGTWTAHEVLPGRGRRGQAQMCARRVLGSQTHVPHVTGAGVLSSLQNAGPTAIRKATWQPLKLIPLLPLATVPKQEQRHCQWPQQRCELPSNTHVARGRRAPPHAQPGYAELVGRGRGLREGARQILCERR